jgi:hypothetical protein
MRLATGADAAQATVNDVQITVGWEQLDALRDARAEIGRQSDGGA